MNSDVVALNEFLSFPLNSTNEIFTKFKSIENHFYKENKKSKDRKFLFVEGTKEKKVVLIAHADTVWREDTYSIQEIIEQDGFFIGKNANLGIGADDRAGCAIVWLLRNSGHSLLILDGEELGSLSAKWIQNSYPELMDKLNQHQFMIEFDRRNSTDCKCYNVGTNDFRKFIENETGYTEPNRTSSTDITVICRDICGVNLSVGYYDEHTTNERINISEWQNTLEITRKLLGNDLPRFNLI